MKLIVGLGNPGQKYQPTRHNVGWLVLDKLIGTAKWRESKNANALYLQQEINGTQVEFIKPLTFMNNSGFSVASALKKHPALKPATDLIVIHDDVDLPVGKIKISQNSGSAGHKGVESIIERIGTKNFIRLRIGIGKDEHIPTDSYVLKKLPPADMKIIKALTDDIKIGLAEMIK